MVEIYGFSGKLGTGKDFLARSFNMMLQPTQTVFLAFADVLKYNGIVKYGLDPDKVFGRKDEATRIRLQLLGTEEGRNKYGPDVWVNYMRQLVHQHISRGIKRIFITDVRFPNEVDFVTNELRGKVFRIKAPIRNLTRLKEEFGEDWQKAARHLSETALDGYEDHQFSYILHNDPGTSYSGQNSIERIREIVLELSKANKDVVFFVDLDDTICRCHYYYHEAFEKARKLVLNSVTDGRYVRSPDYFSIYTKDWFLKPMDRTDFAYSLVGMAKSMSLITDSLADEIFQIGMSVHDQEFTALPGAIEAIKLLATKGKVVIFTIGHRSDQARKIIKLGLGEIVYAVECSSIKNATMFTALKNKYPASKRYMFGDSMVRDILPALEAGDMEVYHIKPEIGDVAHSDARVKTYTTLLDAVKEVLEVPLTMML